MCGITGVYAKTVAGKRYFGGVDRAVEKLNRRGPDGHGVFEHGKAKLGHARLAIIDTSNAASQPFTDKSGRYTIVFNGEIFNYRECRTQLENDNVTFVSSSDTEVLLDLYIREGARCLERLSGFYAFVIYDHQEETLFAARDRYGKKPLLYCDTPDALVFASEMKSLLEYGIDKELDTESLLAYLQLNYIPAPHSIFRNVKKLLPGHYLTISQQRVEIKQYYTITPVVDTTISYASAQHKIVSLMDEAVKKRLVSDVPLGAFLSGGIDSSVVVALASRYVNQLETFSVGFRDEPFFDETYYANLVAKKFYTKHTVFSLSNNDMFQVLFDAMDYIDEPFADSSALAVYLLSKQTRKHVTVALSGDGADEMFAGYHKHMAHFRAVNRPLTNLAIKAVSPVFEHVPQSRNSIMSNLARQLTRYAGGLKLNDRERYWRWCSFASENVARQLLAVEVQEDLYNDRKSKILEHMDSGTGLNNVLLSDMNLVLLNDMLVKVDLMSMANSLEIRSPFLDREVVDFAFSLPHDFKIHGGMKKRLLQDAFRHMLPDELYKRPKKGFEVPLLKWLRNELDPVVKDYLLNSQFIKQQDIFNQQAINLLYNQLHSTSPGEAHARVWALLVFQHWYQQFKS